MTPSIDRSIESLSRRLLAVSLLLALPLPATAQSTDATAASPANTVDHRAMHGMPEDAAPAMTHAMDHGAMDHAAKPMSHAHGTDARAGTRSPDYSDGIGHSDMPGMHMLDNPPLAMLRVDQLEATHGRHVNGHARVELLWNHAVAPFWDIQLGLRQDLGEGPPRQWAAFGIQGLALYGFELEATAYAGPSGRTAARLHVEYELLFTQRLVLQPVFEVNLHGRNDVAARTGRGLSDTRLGLRLRYEIRREFAPYVGVVWTHRYGASADYARRDDEPAADRQIVAGVRFWF
jgi:copper resistance protein B